jgi:hypothetical protein
MGATISKRREGGVLQLAKGGSTISKGLAVVAILLTLLFGLIQSVSGIIQAWAAYHNQRSISS